MLSGFLLLTPHRSFDTLPSELPSNKLMPAATNQTVTGRLLQSSARTRKESRKDMGNRIVLLLSLGHLVTDINQGALPALLPFLIAEYHLSYTAAGFIIFGSNIASTVVQPLFGHLADRLSSPWLMPAGIVLAGAGLAATGIVTDYAWVLVSVMVSGIGIAAFHPQGAQMTNRVSGRKQATAMSIFGVGGTLGFAIGPAFATAVVLHWGLRGSVVMAIPAGIMAVLLAWQLSAGLRGERTAAGGRVLVPAGQSHDAWGPFARLTAAVIARAVLFYGFNTFIPLYWIHVLHRSKAAGAMALTVFALSSVIGNLLGGRLADRFGHTRIVTGGLFALIPIAPALLAVTSEPAAFVLLALIGGTLSTTYSPLIILGQKYLPNRVGLSSGVTLGIAVSIGGVATPLVGQVADHYGLWAALAALALTPIPAACLALTLPHPDRVQTPSPSRT
jgi:FSR family fosmidomycin resistance protein-like MFS transporter